MTFFTPNVQFLAIKVRSSKKCMCGIHLLHYILAKIVFEQKF